MTDLVDPATRAGVCVACHVGGESAADHRLMAAGHPRLGFELHTFSELWRTSGGHAHYRADADHARRKGTVPPTTDWVQGLVVNPRAQSMLIAERYGAGGALPDFSLFNCYSCHRAMRLKDWREKPVTGGDPGALRFEDNAARMLLAALAARPALRDGLERDLRRLQSASGDSPAAVREAAAAAVRNLDGIGTALAETPLSAEESAQSLAALVRAAGDGRFPDYAGAEQAAMSIALLAAATGTAADHRTAIDDLFEALADDERHDPARFAALPKAIGR
ncbi:MAG: hypothetical protein FJ197_02305 [Gammaproteobacteria bacterium]|nr:hypothetical protein [Gammaproteobacteria bacterium]